MKDSNHLPKVFRKSLGKSNFLKLILIIIFSVLFSKIIAQQLAFPTAEGFGKNTTGGRGGKLYIVTNLNDAGAGSLREAVEASGKRTVVFAVSGLIQLQSQLTIRNNDISILGQSAPGDGICIGNYTVQISADNIIIRYIRFRPGSLQKTEYDASWGRQNKDIIFDHCSYSWGNDEQASFYDNENFTMQYCIISESFYASDHPKGNHGYGGIWGGWGATFHHNLIANHTSRTPRFCGARYHLETASKEIVDFRNNVIFNWGFNSAYGGEAGNHNMVNNYYKPGPATNSNVKNRIVNPSDTKSDGNPISKWYVTGNFVEGNSTVSADNWNGGVQPGDGNLSLNELKANSPMNSAGISTQSAANAYATVLATAGASLVRDAVDLRAVNGATTGVTNYGGQYGANKGIIDNEGQVGGFPSYNTYNQITDIDKDGMDDEWEKSHGMSVGTKDDAGDVDNDGYTNIEEYLNCITGEGEGCDVVEDCNGVVGGVAFNDNCNTCVGGTTGLEACMQDCAGQWGGSTQTDACGVCLTDNSILPCTASIEAETACDIMGILEDKNLGFSGESYVNTDNQIGSYATWVLNSAQAQTATIGFRYANGGTTSRDGAITINGNAAGNLVLAPTGAWDTWGMTTVNLDLNSGANEIVVTATSADGLANIDVVSFSAGVSDAACLVTSTRNVDHNDRPVITNETVSFSNSTSWNLYNSNGIQVAKGQSENIDLSSYSSGLYILKTTDLHIKIIVQ